MSEMIYLASKSPRRRELLTQIGVAFEVLTVAPGNPDVDESPLAQEDPEHYVERVTRAKASQGLQLITQRQLAPHPVLAADTTLDLDGEIIGKPDDDAHARQILRSLSGRTHRVLTCIALAHAGAVQAITQISTVRFRPLTETDIERYLATGEHRDKAGAYGIQGHAGMFVEHIEGSYTGIMGLPLCETASLLRGIA